MQEQKLVFATQEAQDQLNLGIIHPFESPFNLFLNFEQLIDYNKRYVYFFVYSIGKRKVMLWGVYDKKKEQFIVDGSCKYKPVQLKEITDKWLKSGYKYVGNTVMDRITPLIEKYTDTAVMDYDDYVDKKRLWRYLNGEIDEKQMIKKYGRNFLENLLPEDINPDDDYIMEEYKFDLGKELAKYEKMINRLDLNHQLLGLLNTPIKRLVADISKKFENAIQTGKFYSQNYENMIKACPNFEQCRAKANKECQLYTFGNVGQTYSGESSDGEEEELNLM